MARLVWPRQVFIDRWCVLLNRCSMKCSCAQEGKRPMIMSPDLQVDFLCCSSPLSSHTTDVIQQISFCRFGCAIPEREVLIRLASTPHPVDQSPQAHSQHNIIMHWAIHKRPEYASIIYVSKIMYSWLWLTCFGNTSSFSHALNDDSLSDMQPCGRCRSANPHLQHDREHG